MNLSPSRLKTDSSPSGGSAEGAMGANMSIRYRQVPLGGSLQAHFERRSDGVTLVTSTEPLRDYPERLTDRLLQWAETAPDRTLVARRERGSGPWQRVSYAQALAAPRSIAQADDQAKQRMRDFLDGKAGKVGKS